MTCTASNMFRSHDESAHGLFEVLAFAMIVIQDFLLY